MACGAKEIRKVTTARPKGADHSRARQAGTHSAVMSSESNSTAL